MEFKLCNIVTFYVCFFSTLEFFAECGPLNLLPVDWDKQAQRTLHDILERAPIQRPAKNVIMFLGDGMGVSTVTAARILRGQMEGRPGEEGMLSFEEFHNVALSKTYNVDRQVPDSGATATAYLCGVKAQMGTIGVNQAVDRSRCDQVKGNKVTSIARWAQLQGKASGIVTTTRITHATPAASYSHSADRNWEADVGVDGRRHGCTDIASQLIHGDTGKGLNVILGGGRKYFMSVNSTDPEYPEKHGARDDGRNLINEWFAVKEGWNAEYVWTKEQLNNVELSDTDYLMGLFEHDHMAYELERDMDAEPSLEEMTEKAIRMLQRDKDGFFLLVEGGRIDHAHHNGLAKKALSEVVAMDRAVAKALELTSKEDTLIVVTADHSHVFTMAGYPPRGNPLFGFSREKSSWGKDDMPYLTLGYANGPGGLYPGQSRVNVTQLDTEDKDFVFPSHVPLRHETHGGEDVGIYASGPMAHIFQGVLEQNYIAHAMGFAACIGSNRKLCGDEVYSHNGASSSSSALMMTRNKDSSFITHTIVFIFLYMICLVP